MKIVVNKVKVQGDLEMSFTKGIGHVELSFAEQPDVQVNVDVVRGTTAASPITHHPSPVARRPSPVALEYTLRPLSGLVRVRRSCCAYGGAVARTKELVRQTTAARLAATLLRTTSPPIHRKPLEMHCARLLPLCCC